MAELDRSQDRPSVQIDDDGVMHIRASSVGGCLRALVASARGEEEQPTPDWMQEKFDQGHAAEPAMRRHALARLNEYRLVGRRYVVINELPGLSTAADGQFQAWFEASGPFAGHRALVESTLDDVMAVPASEGRPGHYAMCEYKALGKSYFAKAKAAYRKARDAKGSERELFDAVVNALPATYAMQVSACQHGLSSLVGESVPAYLFLGLKNDEGLIDDDSELIVVRRDHPMVSLGEFDQKVEALAEWVFEKPWGEFPPCDVEQYPCPFYLLHDEAEDVPVVDGFDELVLRAALADREAGKVMSADAKKLTAEANTRIKDVMGDRKKVSVVDDEIAGPGFTISWVETIVQASTKTVTTKQHTRSYPTVTMNKQITKPAPETPSDGNTNTDRGE